MAETKQFNLLDTRSAVKLLLALSQYRETLVELIEELSRLASTSWKDLQHGLFSDSLPTKKDATDTQWNARSTPSRSQTSTRRREGREIFGRKEISDVLNVWRLCVLELDVRILPFPFWRRRFSNLVSHRTQRNVAEVVRDDEGGACKIFIVKFTNEPTEVAILEQLAESRLTPRLLSKHDVCGGSLLWIEHAGRTLSNTINDGPLLSDKDLETFALQVYSLTVELHKIGIAHRDIKPSNIVLSQVTGRLLLIDFGISTILKNNQQCGRSLVGTEGWTAPEVGSGRDYELIPADLWACGKVIEYLCRHARPTLLRDDLQECAAKLMDKDVCRRMDSLEQVHLRLKRCEAKAADWS